MIKPLAEAMMDPIIPTKEIWDELVQQAEALGYTVVLVEYCESADTPGILGQANGSIHYSKKIIRVREGLDDARRRQTLAHELDHAREPDNGKEIDERWYERRIAALADELEANDV